MTTLWAVHIGGSDDLVACPDRISAEELAGTLRLVDELADLRADFPETPRLRPSIVEWPYSPEAHAAQLANRDPHRGHKQPTVVPGSDTSFPDATHG